MSNSKFSFEQHTEESDRKNENDRPKILIALFFLLISFSCIFCSSQGALWFISEDRVEASILSNRMADYGVNLEVAAAPLNRDLLATEIYQDTILLQQTVTTSGIGDAAVMVIPTSFPTPTPIPVAQLLPTLTPTPTPTPLPPPTATPNPTSPPVSTVPPTVDTSPTPIPATSTPESPTPEPPTPEPPTPIPPTPTDVIPTPTDPPPTSPPPTVPPTTPPNNPPVAANDTATTNEDTAVTINVLSNDSDSDGTIDSTTVTIISGPSNGGAVVNGTTGQITYTPNSNYSGNDSFSYQVCDNDGDCDTATVSITINPVNDPPIAVDDTSNTGNGTPITITVLSNDSDPDVGDTLSVIAVGGSSGTIRINIDNTVTYTPTAGITGMHTFTYTIQDSGGLTDSAVVSVTVTTPPVAVDDYVITAEDVPAFIDVLNNDSDLDGDPLTVTFVSTPSNGTATINVPGYTVTYTPNPNYFGFDTFTYIISDGIYTDTATVNIIIVPVNDTPVAVDDSYSTPVSSTLVISAPGLLSNDFDVDGLGLTVNITSVSLPSDGILGVNADGSFNYVAPAVPGDYTFTYRAQDTLSTPSNVATVTITVTP